MGKNIFKKEKHRKSKSFHIKTLISEANTHFINKEYNRSIEVLKKIIKEKPNDYHSYYLLGVINEELGNLELTYSFLGVCSDLRSKNLNIKKKIYEIGVLLNKKPAELVKILDSILKIEKDKEILELKLKLSSENGLETKKYEALAELNIFDRKLLEEIVENKNVNKKVLARFFKNCIKEDKLFIIENLFKNKFYSLFIKYYQKVSISDTKFELMFFISKEICSRKNIKNNENFCINLNTTHINLHTIDTPNFLTSFSDKNSELYLKYATLCRKNKKTEESKKIFSLLSENTQDKRIKLKSLKKLVHLIDDSSLKLEIYTKCIEIKPNDSNVLIIMSDLYAEMGNKFLSYEFLERANFFNKKTDFNFKKEELITENKEEYDVEEIEKIYLGSLELFKSRFFCEESSRKFLKISKILIKNLLKNRKINPEVQKNKTKEKELRNNVLKKESGLSQEEWFLVILNHIEFLLEKNKINESLEFIRILERSIILKNNSIYFLQIMLIGIKICVLYSKEVEVFYFFRRIEVSYSDNSVVYFMHYILTFMPEAYKNDQYAITVRTFQRTIKKKIECEEKLERLLISHTPIFVYSSTIQNLDVIMKNFNTNNLNISIIYATILFNNAKSRKIFDRSYVIKKGFDSLFKLLEHTKEDNEAKYTILYNLGRAYHNFGLLGKAELYYWKCSEIKIESEIKEAAFMNLYLIYENANNKIMLKILREKFIIH